MCRIRQCKTCHSVLKRRIKKLNSEEVVENGSLAEPLSNIFHINEIDKAFGCIKISDKDIYYSVG